MTQTLTFEYDPLSEVAQQLIALLRVSKEVKVIESPYDPQFVKRVKRAAKEPVQRVKTKVAMKEARSADLKTYSDVKEMMTDILS